MRLLIFFVCTLILNTFPISHAYAEDSSPSADVKTKLEELKKEIASKAAKLKSEINKKLTDKAFVGVIKSKSATSITLAAKTGTKVVTINQDTVYQDTSNQKKKTIDSLKEEDYIVALGDIDDTGVLTARKVIALPPAVKDAQPKAFFWGQIVSASGDVTTIKLKDSKTISIDTSKVDSPYKKDNTVIVTGNINKNGVLDSSFLYVLEGTASATPKPAHSATPSASPKK